VPQAAIAALAEWSWIDDREGVILIGESGTGKTHLAIGLAVCAGQQGRRVRFTTLAGLANELQEAESRRELARVVGRYAGRGDYRRLMALLADIEPSYASIRRTSVSSTGLVAARGDNCRPGPIRAQPESPYERATKTGHLVVAAGSSVALEGVAGGLTKVMAWAEWQQRSSSRPRHAASSSAGRRA
jgi:IstB-like ATP binding protein